MKRKINYFFATGSVNAVPAGINERRFMINKERKPMKATPFNFIKIIAAGYIAGQSLIWICGVI